MNKGIHERHLSQSKRLKKFTCDYCLLALKLMNVKGACFSYGSFSELSEKCVFSNLAEESR